MNSKNLTKNDVCLVGHPYAPIGMGEHIRATFRSLCKSYQPPKVVDIYKLETPNRLELEEFSDSLQSNSSAINIFHINGNEVEQVLNHLNYNEKWDGYNVIYPLWELPIYPAEWAKQLDRFDEIWAPSKFILDGLKNACLKPIHHMPLACEILLDGFLSRRYFDIPEANYTFLFFYDLRSYSSRKNPEGVVRAFRKLLEQRPYSKAHLVIKVNGVETNPEAFQALNDELSDLHANISLINRAMTSNEVKNLLRCCDCFVSLHRSEGFGFGIAEAMVLGKPVIATAYSGNMDFMDNNSALCVDYKLIPVAEGAYPHHEGQVWADPDYDQAARLMVRLLDDPKSGRDLGIKARQHMQCKFDYRQTGIRYKDRLANIRSTIQRSN